jgi:signal transduction histidine kinase
MAASPITHTVAAPRSAWGLDRLFSVAGKNTVIRLRWPLVILSSYLLYYTPSVWLTETQIQAILILYLLSHTTLYFLSDELFDSPYFYGPLLVFDTLVLLAVLSTSGTASTDFYAACLFTLVISCICNDARGLLAVTFLVPLAYAYFVFSSSSVVDPAVYLRLPFPFVISLFYGYFAQFARIRRKAREKDDQAKQQQRAVEEIRRQRERVEVLHQINIALTSTIDSAKLVDSLLTTSLIYLPYAAALVRLKNRGIGAISTATARGLQDKQLLGAAELLEFLDRNVSAGSVVSVSNVFCDPKIENARFLELEGLSSLVAVPLIANKEMLGYLVFLVREEHDFGSEEVDFLSTLAGQAAMAIHHAELYQESQRQANELRNAHGIKDEFLRVVSAELKTPLNVITGYAGMFLEGLLGGMTPLQEKAMETVARQSKELHGLINTVLQVSNIETEPLHLELRELDVWEFLSELRTAYDFPLGSDMKLVWDYPQDFPTVQGDRLKVRHILENLIDNAIKFTERGTVTISARYLEKRKSLEFRVSDTGRGIPQNEIPRIFLKFQRGADAEANAPRSGVGLGLYVVKKYLELLGGEIRVESSVGKGSTFTLRIPAPIKQSWSVQEQLLLPTAFENISAARR